MRTAALILAGIAAGALGGYLFHQSAMDRLTGQVNGFLGEVRTLERAVIENVPVYEDFATPEIEGSLRRYLLQDHIAAARSQGAVPVNGTGDIPDLVKSGKLVPVDTGGDAPWYAYGLSPDNRYLAPRAVSGLERIARRFNERLASIGAKLPVKLALSSALRTPAYQEKLRRRNENASETSSHWYGTSFDIFYDDYYVSPGNSLPGSLSLLGNRWGFLMGDALRRQLRTVLTETLLELQNDGLLYAILERRQRCYHITIVR